MDNRRLKRVYKGWVFLVDNEYFTYEELLLAFSLRGYSVKTLNEVCAIRYAKNLEQLGFENE